MELNVIAYAHNGHSDKFGIPRQSRDESPIVTRIVFEPEYSVPEAFRGIEGFSHLWIIWGFGNVQRDNVQGTKEINGQRDNVQCTKEINGQRDDVQCTKEINGQRDDVQCTKEGLSWSPTVRPPRLGGNKRMGVFATRSPFRPNALGMSSVKLIRVNPFPALPSREGEKEQGTKGSIELIVSGADLLDGTPIYDIKPYLRYSDSHPDAVDGFAAATENYRLQVIYDESLMTGDASLMTHDHSPVTHVPEDVLRDIEYILSQDPRPAYQDDPTREYRMDYGGWRVTFCVGNGTVCIKNIEKI